MNARFSNRMVCVMLGIAAVSPRLVLAQSDSRDARDELEEIVVTGSRLARPDSSAPIPVTSVNAEDIEASGVTLISDFLQELPMFGINSGRMTEIGGGEVNRPSETAGTERLNLRDLGVERTLVVVNGRRHVGSTAGSTAVDVSSIPTALIERVEISTGGASTAYGADAIAGVTNFIMKKDFEGVQIDSRYGDSEEGGGENKYLALTIGSNFAEGRGNAVFSASYNTLGGIRGLDRSWVRERWGFVPNPLDTGPNDGQPSLILRSNTRPIEVLNNQGALLGLIDSVLELDAMLIFNDDGSVRPFAYGDPQGLGGTVVGGDGADLASGMNVATPMERKSIFGSLNYALTEKTNFFLEAKTYMSDVQVISPAMLDAVIYPETDGELFLVYPDNPFLPSSPLLDDMFARNFGLVTFMKYHDDLPLREADISRVLNRVVAGVEGETGFRDWRYEISGTYGRTTEEYREFNNRDPLRWRLATNPVTDVAGVTGVAPGTPVCRETLAAALAGGTTNPDILECRPINIFGRGNQSQESLDYVLIDLLTNKSLEQIVVGASLNGTLFELPAGSVSFATGVEYRQERSETLPDNMQQTGQTHTPSVPATVGKYDVAEAYLEARLPLLTDAPFAELLAIEGGFRASDNNVTGSSNSWRAGGEWAPVRDVRFRGMYARAVRAPNISELFTPQSARFAGSVVAVDPCNMNNVGDGPAPERRLANCTADLARLGLDPRTWEPDPNFVGSSYGAIGGGNPDLTEEVATSITYGVVFNPRFLENLTVSVDFYDIEIDGVITSPDAVSVTNGCYDNFDTIDNGLCALLTRNSDPTSLGYGTIASALLITRNLARLSASGIDFQADYRWREIGPGTLSARLIANYVNSYKEKPLEDAVLSDELVGGPRLPEIRGGVQLGYHTPSLSMNYQIRYIDGVRFARVAPLNPIETISPYKIGSETISDVSAMYRFEAGNFGFQFSLGVNNVFDTEPPPGSRTGRFAGGSPYYDPIGRFYYGGLSVSF